MSDLLSRPIDQQGEGVRLFVGAVRRWVRAAVNGRCVCHVIGAAFKAAGLEKGAAPFHAAMQTLCNNARQPLRFGTADRAWLSAHEVRLVEALRAASEERPTELRRIAGELVFPDLAPALAVALTSVAAEFRRAQLPLI
ncbi:MAG TPA: hypothetical protein VKY80_00525 [Croceibacterium sp.]|nr:hypothetical protein [Croceibacterium sp.]